MAGSYIQLARQLLEILVDGDRKKCGAMLLILVQWCPHGGNKSVESVRFEITTQIMSYRCKPSCNTLQLVLPYTRPTNHSANSNFDDCWQPLIQSGGVICRLASELYSTSFSSPRRCKMASRIATRISCKFSTHLQLVTYNSRFEQTTAASLKLLKHIIT